MPTPSRERVAANVRAEAARRQQTQADLAVVLGKTQQSISKKFRGLIPFDLDELEVLAAHFDVPVERFVAAEAVA